MCCFMVGETHFPSKRKSEKTHNKTQQNKKKIGACPSAQKGSPFSSGSDLRHLFQWLLNSFLYLCATNFRLREKLQEEFLCTPHSVYPPLNILYALSARGRTKVFALKSIFVVIPWRQGFITSHRDCGHNLLTGPIANRLHLCMQSSLGARRERGPPWRSELQMKCPPHLGLQIPPVSRSQLASPTLALMADF